MVIGEMSKTLPWIVMAPLVSRKQNTYFFNKILPLWGLCQIQGEIFSTFNIPTFA
jgi:hypothetical protein